MTVTACEPGEPQVERAEQVEIDGITYDIIRRDTAESLRAEGHIHTADAMERHRAIADLYVSRPKGRVIHTVWEYTPSKTGRRRFGKLIRWGQR